MNAPKQSIVVILLYVVVITLFISIIFSFSTVLEIRDISQNKFQLFERNLLEKNNSLHRIIFAFHRFISQKPANPDQPEIIKFDNTNNCRPFVGHALTAAVTINEASLAAILGDDPLLLLERNRQFQSDYMKWVKTLVQKCDEIRMSDALPEKLALSKEFHDIAFSFIHSLEEYSYILIQIEAHYYVFLKGNVTHELSHLNSYIYVLGITAILSILLTLGYWHLRKKNLGQLRLHRDHLEDLVKNRTETLIKTNQELQKEITERRSAEVALQKAHHDLENKVKERTKDYKKAKEEAETANLAKSEFLSNMSHELKTPMHHILSYSRFGIDKIDKVTPKKLVNYFSKIRTISYNLLALVNNILDLSELRYDKMDFNIQKRGIAQIISDVSTEFFSVFEEKGVLLENKTKNNADVVFCDDVRIRQVLRHLLANALRFTSKGKKITISISPNHFPAGKKPTTDNQVPAICICVEDEGIGIPEGELNSIFDKFVQSSKTKTGAGGTGLGLAICNEIINVHQGKIWAENNSKAGSRFCFTLPQIAD